MQPRPYRGTSVVRSEINPVDNAELKAGQGKLPVAGEKRCDQFHIVEVPPQRAGRPHRGKIRAAFREARLP